jgi:diacylglycerol kinase family enzyme/membrane-associated phospholipid phosphatase
MRKRNDRRTVRWTDVQRRVRASVPAPVRRADLWAFRSTARAEIPILGPVLPWLSRAANHSRLWAGLAVLLAASGGRFGRRAALRGLLAVTVTSAVTNLPAKLLTGRTRPDLGAVPEVRRLARVPSSTSFPSGHSASAFAFATAVALERPDVRIPLNALAGAVALSRVYTGVHYPGDVLIGSAIGIAVARGTVRVWPLADDAPAVGGDVDGSPAPARRYVDADGTGLVVVANSGAGNVLAEGPAEQLRRELPGARIQETDPEEDLPAALRRAASVARVLGVAGGDGSASAAADVAAEAGIPLLVIPAGTLNHLAGDLGIEATADAIHAVRRGRVVRMDLGDIDGHGFVNAASIGAYPHLVDDREDLEDRIGKWPAALWSLLRILMTHEPTRLTVDGRERRVWLLFVGNGTFVSEGLAPTRRRRLDDGCLDVRLVDADRSWARARVLGSMMVGRLARCSSYQRWTSDHLEVRTHEQTLQLAADGETWRGPDTVEFRIRPGVLMVVQPPPSDSGPARR